MAARASSLGSACSTPFDWTHFSFWSASTTLRSTTQRRKESEIRNTRVIKPNVAYCTIEGNHHLMMQPLLTGDSAVSFSDRELQDLLSCQEPTLGSLPVSELFLLATTGPGPDPRLSRLILGPADSEGTFSPPGPSGSLPESLLVRLPFRLSEEETWLIWPSRSSREDRGTFTEVFLHFLSFFLLLFSFQFNSIQNLTDSSQIK